MLFRFPNRPTSLSLIFYYIGPALAIIIADLLTGSCSRYCGICGESQWSTIDDHAPNLILPSPSILLSHCRGHKEEPGTTIISVAASRNATCTLAVRDGFLLVATSPIAPALFICHTKHRLCCMDLLLLPRSQELEAKNGCEVPVL